METEKRIKVGVIGLGPVGTILAVKLQEAGCEVALVEASGTKADLLRREGVILNNVIEAHTHFEHVYTSASELSGWDADYLFLAIKSNHTADTVRLLEPLLTEKLTVVSAQNGIDVEHITASALGETRTLRMVINFAGNTTAPNATKVTFFTPPNYIGSINDARADRATELAAMLSSVGLETYAVDSFELLRRVWEKTILNASLSALCGVSRLTMEEAMNDPDTVELIEQVIAEGIEVAEAEKIRFPDDFLRKCLRYLKMGGDHFPSLAVDLISNRPTEIDHFNGKIVEYGRKHYVRTTLNLTMTNMVKAMTSKNVVNRLPGTMGDGNRRLIAKSMVTRGAMPLQYRGQICYLGIDLGSAHTKFTVTDAAGAPVLRHSIPTVGGDRKALDNMLKAITAEFDIAASCATGYGRKVFSGADMAKTEITCAAAGVAYNIKGAKNIIDIGGEDIKVIRCDANDQVGNFNMNDKCAAGTGAFLTEIADRAGIGVADMSGLAAHSSQSQELNSFCTVFAKTEIMNWIMEGMTPQDIARGIYISIANRVAKMRLEPGIPTMMIGGVIAHHPYMAVLLAEKFKIEVIVADAPQFAVSHGAALIARASSSKHGKNQEEKETATDITTA